MLDVFTAVSEKKSWTQILSVMESYHSFESEEEPFPKIQGELFAHPHFDSPSKT